MVTTRIITPDSVSSRSDQATSTPPPEIQVAIVSTWGADWPMIWWKTMMPKIADRISAPQVTTCDPRKEDNESGHPGSAFHHSDVLDPDRAAIAEIDDEDRQADRRLSGRHGQ